MKTIIGNKAFITELKYSKPISKREYEILKLKERLKNLEADDSADSADTIQVLDRTQRVSTCFIVVGDKEARGECKVAVNVSVVNHPAEEFTRHEGRKRSFAKAMDAMFGSPMLLSMLDLTEADRKVFERQFKGSDK